MRYLAFLSCALALLFLPSIYGDSLQEVEGIDSEQVQETEMEENDMETEQEQDLQESQIPHDWD